MGVWGRRPPMVDQRDCGDHREEEAGPRDRETLPLPDPDERDEAGNGEADQDLNDEHVTSFCE